MDYFILGFLCGVVMTVALVVYIRFLGWAGEKME